MSLYNNIYPRKNKPAEEVKPVIQLSVPQNPPVVSETVKPVVLPLPVPQAQIQPVVNSAPSLTSGIYPQSPAVAPAPPSIMQGVYPRNLPAADDVNPDNPFAGIYPQNSVADAPTAPVRQPPTLTTAVPISPLERAENIYNRKRDAIVENNDKGVGGFLKQFLQNWAYGANNTFRSNPNAKLTDVIFGGLGAGIGGSINNRADEQRAKDADVSRAYQDYQTQSAIAKQNQERQKLQMETQGELLKNRKTVSDISAQEVKTINEKISPLMDVIKAQKKITPALAKYLTEVTNVPFDAAQWQTYVEKEINGKSNIRPEFSPIYQQNDTLPTNPGGVYRDVSIGENPPIPVKTDAIPEMQISIDNSNANRKQRNIEFTTSEQRHREEFNATQRMKAQTENANNLNNYNSKLISIATDQAKQRGEVIANAGSVQAKANRVKSLSDEMMKIDLSTDEGQKRHDKLTDEIIKAQSEMEIEVGKTNAGAAAFEQLQKLRPVMPQRIQAQQIPTENKSTINRSREKTTTKEKIREFAKMKNISIVEAQKQAEASGYKVKD